MAAVEGEVETGVPSGPPTDADAQPPAGWLDRHRDDVVTAAIFVAARIVFIAALGVRMDLLFLTFAPHVPDLGLLQHHLLQTVLYEHTQPPGFPLLVGGLMQLSPFPDGITFQVVWLAMGLALALVLYRVGRMIGLGRVATFVGIGLVATNPALVSIEFSANYDEPTILMVALVVLFIGRYARSGSTRHLAAVTTIGAVAVLTRTVFHPAWYLLLVAGLVIARRPAWPDRKVALAIALPALAIGAFVAKNSILYGETNLTSWGGPSLDKIATSAAPPALQRQLVRDGTVSKLFGTQVFIEPYSAYAAGVPPCRPKHAAVPVLSEQTRPSDPTFDGTTSSPNLNYECFLPVYRQQDRDARAFIAKYPARFLGAQADGAQMFFEPALQIVFTPQNLKALAGADTVWRWTLYPRVTVAPIAYSDWAGRRVLAYGGMRFVPTVFLLDVAAVVLAVSAAGRLWPQRRRTGGGDRRSALAARAAIGLTCAWVTVIGSAFEINENARYRLLIEPFLLLLLAWAGEGAVHAIRRRAAADPTPARRARPAGSATRRRAPDRA